MNLYFLIYFWIYQATYRTNKSVIEWSSMITLSVLIYFNFVTLIIYLDGGWINSLNGKLIFIGGIIGSLTINYFIFLLNDRYKLIIEKYKENKFAKSFLGIAFVVLYVAVSIYLFFKVLDIL